MNKIISTVAVTIGLVSAGGYALAAEAKPSPPPQEPVGFIAGGIIGGLTAGPIGAVVGAGLGTWLGNRVHRAGEAAKSEVAAAQSEAAAAEAQAEAATLRHEREALSASNQALSDRLGQLSHSAEMAVGAQSEAVQVLDGLQGDVLFRTGSRDIPEQNAHEIEVLALAVAKSPHLKIRVDGYADPRGTPDANLELSAERADAVRDLLLAAGVREDAMEVHAYGDSQSMAEDLDGYALERRVRLTLQADGARDGGAEVVRVGSP